MIAGSFNDVIDVLSFDQLCQFYRVSIAVNYLTPINRYLSMPYGVRISNSTFSDNWQRLIIVIEYGETFFFLLLAPLNNGLRY